MMTIDDISQLDLSKRYSYTDYLGWRFKEKVELIKGKIFKMSPAPSRRHQEISFNLTIHLGQYFQKKPCKVYVAPFDVRLPIPKGEDAFTVVQPDLSVICDLEKLDDQGCNGAPDLVIEILSPGNAAREMQLKYEVYQEAGVREYWVVDPEREIVSPFVLQENGVYIGKQPKTSDREIVSSIFPDLVVDLKEVFGE